MSNKVDTGLRRIGNTPVFSLTLTPTKHDLSHTDVELIDVGTTTVFQPHSGKVGKVISLSLCAYGNSETPPLNTAELNLIGRVPATLLSAYTCGQGLLKESGQIAAVLHFDWKMPLELQDDEYLELENLNDDMRSYVCITYYEEDAP